MAMPPQYIVCSASFLCVVVVPVLRGCASLPQVVKDYECVPIIVKGKEETAEGPAKAMVACGRAWLKRGHPDGGQSFRPRKQKRAKAYQWLVSLHRQLQLASSGRWGLNVLLQDEDMSKRGSAFEWPSVSVCMDQGPDGCAALHWAQRAAHMNIDGVFDLSHLGSCALKEGVNGAGLKAFTSLMGLAYRAKHGPWDEGIRWQQAKEAMGTYIQCMSPVDCPRFEKALPKILRDKGELGRLKEDGIHEELWQTWVKGLPWACRGTPISDARFSGTIREAETEDKVWHEHAMAYELACLELDSV